MIKCVRILVFAQLSIETLQNYVQKPARSLKIEGSAHKGENSTKIIACGEKEQVDQFVDIIHKDLAGYSEEPIEVEPFLKDRDYRGVFRIIQ